MTGGRYVPSDATQLLAELRGGGRGAAEKLFPLVYDELRRLAANLLRRERPDHTLQTTALVHEAYLRLVKQDQADWRDRAHFCAVAAQAMRRILVDHARRRNRQKRSGGRDRVPLDSALISVYESAAGLDLEALDTALERLAPINPRAAQVVEMRFFGGLTMDEVATVLGISLSSVEREWRYARAWLRRALADEGSHVKTGSEDGNATRTTGG